MKYLILHGSFGSPDNHWFPWLRKALVKRGYDVLTPQMPVGIYNEAEKEFKETGAYIPKEQTLENWIQEYERTIKPWMGNPEEVVVVAHSVAPVFVLQLIQNYQIEFNSAIFVSPFYEKIQLGGLFDNIIDDFAEDDFDFGLVRKLLKTSYSIYSDNDPYIETKYINNFVKKVNSIPIELKNGGHLGEEIDSFPLVLELCKGVDDYLKE